MSDEKSPLRAITEPIKELAKAGQEQQKTLQAAIALTERAGRFLGRIFGPAADEFGLALGERTRLWRFKNLNAMMLKVEEMAEKRAIHPEAMKVLPFGMAVRVIQAASNEEEDSVQDLWARLTTNAIDPQANTTVSKVHIDILKSLSPTEAALLDLLWEGETHANLITGPTVDAFNKAMNTIADQGWRRFDAVQRRVATQNLVRLRCITSRPTRLDVHGLLELTDATWPSRTGTVNPHKFEQLLTWMLKMISVSAGLEDPAPGRTGTFGTRVPEMSFALTPLGRGLMYACRRTVAEKRNADIKDEEQ